jgi:hypothetical protein
MRVFKPTFRFIGISKLIPAIIATAIFGGRVYHLWPFPVWLVTWRPQYAY